MIVVVGRVSLYRVIDRRTHLSVDGSEVITIDTEAALLVVVQTIIAHILQVT